MSEQENEAQTAGKYDKAAAMVMVATQAELVLLCVINGVCGCGFSITMAEEHSAHLKHLPGTLRTIADNIEKDGHTKAERMTIDITLPSGGGNN